MTETQQRFLKAIAERLGERPVVEVRLFPAIRQGQHESGVAVIAVEEPAPPAEPVTASATLDGAPVPDDMAPAAVVSTPQPAQAASSRQPAVSRLSILTARFRLTVKGPDRGKWEFDLVHDADAPLETIEPVVRGVARRVGEAGEPDLLSPAAFQRAITEPWWAAPA